MQGGKYVTPFSEKSVASPWRDVLLSMCAEMEIDEGVDGRERGGKKKNEIEKEMVIKKGKERGG